VIRLVRFRGYSSPKYAAKWTSKSSAPYAAQSDGRMNVRVDKTTMRGTPATLTNQEFELDVQPLTQTPIPVPARAWVRYTGVANKTAA
jgi:hypothetical protein